MASVFNAEAVDGFYWVSSLDLPDAIKGRMVLTSVVGRKSDEFETVMMDGERLPVSRVPLVDIGYKDESAVYDAILQAMDYDARVEPVI